LADAANAAARAIGNATDMAPPKPGLLSEIGHGIENVASSAWHDTVQVSEDAASITASFASASFHDPGALVEIAGGLLLTGVSAGGEAIGLLATASGVLSLPGGALDVLAAGGITAGVGLTGVGIAQMAKDVSGPDRVSIAQSSSSGGSGDIMEPALDNGGEAHIKDTHFAGGVDANDTKGLFNDDVDLDEIAEQSQGTPPTGPNRAGFYERTFNTGKFIGVTSKDGGAAPTSWVTLVQDKYGAIITMFPVSPAG
jgi:hypothetical protein